MQSEPMLERLAWIIKTYGVISSDFYDRLSVERPSRWSLRQQYGTWKGAVESAIKLLESQGTKVESPQIEENTSTDAQVLKLTQQIAELSRHFQTSELCFTGTTHRFGMISDTHIGSLFCDKALLNYAYEVFAEEGIKTVLHAGDILDGMQMYKGHPFELEAQGSDAQVSLAVEQYPKHKGITTYFITGNHDRSFWKLSGTEVGSKISAQRPDMVHIGHQEADIKIGEDDAIATIRLCHPDGGTAYAISYKIQQYVNALPSGQKPDILITGHYHKTEELYYRGVVCYQAGCIQAQTPYMRGKQLAAAMGFRILEVTVAPKRVVRVTSTFFPVRS
jgi:predicted phosphodiesterase